MTLVEEIAKLQEEAKASIQVACEVFDSINLHCEHFLSQNILLDK